MCIQQHACRDQRTILSHCLEQASGFLILWNARVAGLQTFENLPEPSNFSTGALVFLTHANKSGFTWESGNQNQVPNNALKHSTIEPSSKHFTLSSCWA